MTMLLTVLHIGVCIFLIAVVLLQSGKGAEMGAAFGGSSQTLFGSRGAASFLSKLTTFAAVVFMLTSLTLAILTSRGGSVIKETTGSKQEQSVPSASGPVQSSQQQAPLSQPQEAPLNPQQKSPQ